MDCCTNEHKHESKSEKKYSERAEHSEHSENVGHHRDAGQSTGSFIKENKHYIIIGIVGLLLIFSLVQAVQLSGARVDLAVAQAGAGQASPAVSGGGAQASQQQASTPTMVGGC